ncbi:hypothetical protein EDB83DRAFT_1824397 [Lactarius deliciosus]|nr:hypothetical protein EDB83DRAFT_1824397 [Lactarius deliciosus]
MSLAAVVTGSSVSLALARSAPAAPLKSPLPPPRLHASPWLLPPPFATQEFSITTPSLRTGPVTTHPLRCLTNTCKKWPPHRTSQVFAASTLLHASPWTTASTLHHTGACPTTALSRRAKPVTTPPRDAITVWRANPTTPREIPPQHQPNTARKSLPRCKPQMTTMEATTAMVARRWRQ